MNIAFASTGYGPLWPPAVASWLRVCAYTGRYFEINTVGKIGGAGVTDRMYTHAAENKLVKEMLEDPTFTHIFMTESDMILPHDAIVKLAALDVDMASGIYFLRTAEQEKAGQPCLFKRSILTPEEQRSRDDSPYLHAPVHLFPLNSPFRIDCAGLGCILIKRRVFETMKDPWFDLRANSYGSDMFFAKHAKDAGFELWAHPEVMCGQIDYYETTVQDWKWRMENDPDFVKRGFIIGTAEVFPTS